jgi:thiol-disulfide isomerase/thioredoxin
MLHRIVILCPPRLSCVLVVLSLLGFGAGCKSAGDRGAQHAPVAQLQSAASFNKAAVVAAVNRSASAIVSWDVDYDVEWEQTATTVRGENSPATHQNAHVHEIAQGPNLFIDATSHDFNAHSIQTTDGRLVHTMYGPSEGRLAKWTNSEMRSPAAMTYRNFLLTALPQQMQSGAQASPDPLPDLLAFVNDPQTRLLDEPITVNDHPCRVLEKTIVTLIEHRIVAKRSIATTHPQPSTRAATTIAPPRYVNTFRLALDPARGWMPVQLTIRSLISIPPAASVEFPFSQMQIDKATQTRAGVWVPTEASLKIFRNEHELHNIGRLRATSVRVNVPHPPSQFVLSFPNGCVLNDAIRGITYKIGDDPAHIEELLAKRAKEDQFFAGILRKPAPPLRGDVWLAGKPQRLDDLKGRTVIVHFWNIWCGPCVAEIPNLQKLYGTQPDRGLIFISVHTGGGEKERPDIERFIKEHGITFPVLLDASDPAEKGWGLTSEAYGVYAIPTDAFIAADGKLISVGEHKAGE